MTEEATAEAALPAEDLEKALKRCRPEVLQAAQAYRKEGRLELLPKIVVGVIERYVEPERRSLFENGNIQQLRLHEDLGLDSLVMVEVVMTLEEVLGKPIPDSEIQGLYTLGDTLAYAHAKASGAPLPVPPERLGAEMLPVLLGGEEPLVGNVILWMNAAEGTYIGQAPAEPKALMDAAAQLAKVWAQRKEQLPSLTPELSGGKIEIQAELPVALRLVKGSHTDIFYRQAGTPPKLLGHL